MVMPLQLKARRLAEVRTDSESLATCALTADLEIEACLSRQKMELFDFEMYYNE